MPDYYAVLGVDKRATADEIKRAFRRLTKDYHPDRNPGSTDAEDRYREINEAYTVLSDPAARARYDTTSRLQQGLDLTKGFDGQSARDLLGNVLGDVFRNRRKARRKGRDLRYTLTVDLAEAVLGCSHEIEFEGVGICETCDGTGTRPGGAKPQTCQVCTGRGEVKGEGLFAGWTRCGRCDGVGLIQQDACDTCRGTAKRKAKRTFVVRLPPSTDAGTERVIEGQGEPGRFGGEPGALRVTVNIRRHPWLERDGDEIRGELPLSVTEAALGSRIAVPTVDGVVMVDVPAGIRSGTKLRLRGKGVPIPRDKRRRGGPDRGDQIVQVMVETPQAPQNELREILLRLEALCQDEGRLPRRAEHRGFTRTDRTDGEGA